MLEVIETDFSRLETETKADEFESAKTYSTFMAEAKTSKKQKHDHEYKLSLKKDEAIGSAGSNRAQNTAQKKTVSLCSCLSNIIIGFFGVLIIPKWLIHDF